MGRPGRPAGPPGNRGTPRGFPAAIPASTEGEPDAAVSPAGDRQPGRPGRHGRVHGPVRLAALQLSWPAAGHRGPPEAGDAVTAPVSHLGERRLVALACRILAMEGLAETTLGHVSLRVGDRHFLVRGRRAGEHGLAFTTEDDIA